MVEISKTFDGTIEGAISATSKLNGIWAPIQKFMTLGDFKTGISKKIDGSSLEVDEGGENIQNYVSQIAGLDEAQQNAIISATNLGDNVDETVKKLSRAVSEFSRINSRTFESALKNWDEEKILPNDVSNLMAAGGMKNGDNYALPETDKAVDALETYINKVAKADEQNRLYNAGIIEMNGTTYVLTQKFKQLAGIEEAEGAVKAVLTVKQEALNIAMALGKQLMASLIAFGLSLVATKIIEWISNLKTRSEELIDTMNSSHDAAEQATKDVEEIQSKIDELNKSLKDAGVDKIEDIVDPAERERLQAINDMLEAQLELKKQISKDADDKANTDTSAVVNDKSENSIVKSSTQPQVSYDSNGNPITIFSPTPDKVTKTESLQEYTAALEDTTQKRRDLQIELDQIEASSGKDSKEYANKKKELDALNETFESQKTKVEELSTAVSEQMGNYKTDADSFAQYKDEYVAGTNAMTAATKALADAQDDTSVDTTNALRIKRRKKGAAIWTSLYQEEIDLNHVIMKMGWSNLHINKTTGQPMGNYKAVTSDYIDKNRVLSFQFKSEDKAFCLIAYTADRKFIKASSDFTSTDEFRSSSEYKEWFSETFLNNMKYYSMNRFLQMI